MSGKSGKPKRSSKLSMIHADPVLVRRGRFRDQAKKTLGPQIKVIEEMVNYGVNFMKASIEKEGVKLGMVDVLLRTVLLRQTVLMLDAISILLREGSTVPTDLPGRAIFEAICAITWILEGNSDEKARHFYVGQYRKELRWNKRGIGEADGQEKFDKIMTERDGMSRARVPQEQESECRARISEIEEHLARPEYQKINDNFEAFREKRGHDPSWHAPLGPTSIRQLAREAHLLDVWEILYTSTSETAHGGNSRKHVKIGEKGITILSLRGQEEPLSLLGIVLHLYVSVLRKLVEKYSPEDTAELGAIYIERWRTPLQAL